jgi:hypothetical protein
MKHDTPCAAIPKKRLRPADVMRARRAYAALYARALPHAAIAPRRIEVATFNLCGAWKEFRRVGLGLETVVIYRDEAGEGHTGKVLLNLPWQLLVEHEHVDTFVLRRNARVPQGFVGLDRLVNGFSGIRRYRQDGAVLTLHGQPQFVYRQGEFTICQAQDGEKPFPSSRRRDMVRVLGGKSETFKAIYGDGVLLADSAVVLDSPKGVNPSRPPARFLPAIERVRREQVITTRRLIYMTRGACVLLPKGTKHAFLAGPRGAVYLEFSTPSMDEADRFTDPRVVR